MFGEGMEIETSAVPAKATGDDTRPPLPAMPAPKRSVQRRIPVKSRAPFLPDHHGHSRHTLKPHAHDHSAGTPQK